MPGFGCRNSDKVEDQDDDRLASLSARVFENLAAMCGQETSTVPSWANKGRLNFESNLIPLF
jgi:hypothetical protein